MLTQQQLQYHFSYREGKLYWVHPTSRRIYSGREVGGQTAHGYRVLRLLNHFIYAHRAIWIFHNGAIPAGLVVDHINGNSLDNRIQNLRVVSQALNCRNQKPTARSKSGYVGIYKNSHNTWTAQIKTQGRNISLGSYPDINMAIVARTAAEKILGFLTHTHHPL